MKTTYLLLWRYALAALAWTALIAVSLGWSQFEGRREILDNARHPRGISTLAHPRDEMTEPEARRAGILERETK